jgi:signal transduction histidine kinase
MRERVLLYGGDISVGPRPGGGFRISATLPVGAST